MLTPHESFTARRNGTKAQLRIFTKLYEMREGQEKGEMESWELLGFSHPLRLNIVISILQGDV